jgi:hypothetical protein
MGCKDPEKRRATFRVWYLKNKDKQIQWQKEYLQKNKDDILRKRKEYYVKNKEAIRLRKRECRKNNRAKERDYKRRYNSMPENKEKKKSHDAKYRTRPEILARARERSKEYYKKNKEKKRIAGLIWKRKNRVRLNEKSRIYRAANKHKARSSYLKARYGIVSSDYKAMHDNQNGLCAICGKPESLRNQHGAVPLSVDHCHKTNKVRGLLCAQCNQALGMFEDSIEILANAIGYLTKNGGKESSDYTGPNLRLA